MRKQARLICGVGVAFLLLVSAVSNKAMAFKMDVKADLLAATCAISAGVGTATNNEIDMGEVDGDSVTAWSYTAANTRAFNVHLTGCAGLTPGTTTPALTISGLHEWVHPEYRNFFFKTSGTSDGMGIVICTTPACNAAYGNEVPDIAEGGSRPYIAIPNVTSTTNPLGATYDVPLGVTVGCGGCKTGSTRAGSLEADITFNFVYH